LGEHRIICGDCTDEVIIKNVMGSDRARLVWTDPPYGVNYGAKLEDANPMGYRVRMIENDNLPPAELEVFIRSALKNCCDYSLSGGAIYVACPAGTPLPTLIASFVGSGYTFHWGLIWLKDQLVLGRGDYHFKHENILYGWKEDAAHYFVDDRKQTSVFEYPRPKSSEEHPTMKPVDLVAHMISNSSRVGDIVLEPFSGSGSTILACEREGRKCRAIEISPAYVAVSIQRWVDATGGVPELMT
jgi:DNA modification methylase